MPDPRRFEPRRFLGFTGAPLNQPAEAVPLPDAVRERFKRAGQEPFVSYINPWDTLARSEGYQQQATQAQVSDAEDQFVKKLPEIAKSPSGLGNFLNDNPMGNFSPMVQTWERMNRHQAKPDQFEGTVAKAGSDYLKAYREAVAGGQDPMEAFSEFRDVYNDEQDRTKQKTDDQLWFVEKGGDLNDFNDLHGQGMDRAGMLDWVKKRGKPLNSIETKKITDMQADIAKQQSLLDPQDEDAKAAYIASKVQAFHDKYNRDPATQAEWEEAHELMKQQKVGPKQQEYDDYVSLLEENGKRAPKPKATTTTAPSVQNVLQGTPVAPTQVATPSLPSPSPDVAAPYPGWEPGMPRVKPGTVSPLDQVRKNLNKP